MATNSLADKMWNRVCLYHEVLQLTDKIPSALISWKTDNSDIVCVKWLHDMTRPEWGYVTMFINLEHQEYFDACVQELKKLLNRGVSDGH